ncbi:MAG: transglycosylase SLT domain-containing protein [Gammaproteobacteria bacterium]|nr:transglycosylase SLT domain-containing protein [Gammaproteobacteria bacterium]
MARVTVRTIFFPVLGLGLLLASSAVLAATLEQQRVLYDQAMSQLKANKFDTFKRIQKQLVDYPLYPYLEYEYLRKNISRATDKQILDFLSTYDNTPIADRLRYAWLHQLAKQKDWEKLVVNYRSGGGSQLSCQYAEALFRTSREPQAMEESRALWMVAQPQHASCDPAFKIWQSKGGMNREAIWERIELAMDKGRPTLAQFLGKELPLKEDQEWSQRWRRMYDKPAETLHLGIYRKDVPIARKIMRHGIRRLARRDVEAAMGVWQQVRETHLRSDADEVHSLDRFLALRAALVDAPDALKWLGEVEQPNDDIKHWRVRAALKRQDWPAALTWIESLTGEQRDAQEWQYWRARILEIQSGKMPVLKTAAERIYRDLAKERSYHGFMSADRMGLPYQFTSEPLNFSKDSLAELEKRPGFARARELYKVGRFVEARREWFYGIAGFSEDDLRRAAVLADSWGWHDRAIATVALAEHFDDIELRFPMAFRDLVVSSASEQSLDPAWVYGVLRQESSFMTDARSSAGALGLMQLMPLTGRLAARDIKTRVRSNYEILDVNKNIRLGAAYLQRMLQQNSGNSALATASYNAGPYRVSKWIPDVSTPADLWVESIPYGETREYVKRVMAYTVIYDYRLDGQTEQLRQRMPTIQPAGGG